jgi:hypothetical protein
VEDADSVTGYQIRRTYRGQPNDDLYAHPVARVDGNTFTYVHDTSDGIGPENPNRFNFTYYVAAITADGEGFPIKVSVSGN